MIEIVKEFVLDRLSGFNLIVAIIAILAIVLYWWLSGAKEKKRPALIKRLLPVTGIAAVAGLIMLVHRWYAVSQQRFPKWKSVILVAQIDGDDKSNGIQRDLVSTLNTALRQDPALKDVEARALDKVITEATGHDEARKIGKKRNATLVIWGGRGSDLRERIIHPRITVLPKKCVPPKIANQHLESQIIDELRLPPMLVDRPLFLIHFMLAQSNYDRYEFEKALTEFEKCLQQPQEDIINETGIRFWIALCLQNIGMHRGKTESLNRAIELHNSFFDLWTETEYPEFWAMTQNNLGAAYVNLPTSDRNQHLLHIIQCFQNALHVYTEADFPVNWAKAQNNLGITYSKLPAGDRKQHLLCSIQCYQNALRVYTKTDFPMDWAGTQNNLGNAYRILPTGDCSKNIENAIQCYRNALRIFKESDFPVDWARTQINLGAAYINLPTGDRCQNIKRAIKFYRNALKICTKADFPLDWAATQNNLGNAYSILPNDDRAQNLDSAIQFYQNALKVRTESDFPIDWAETQNNLGNAYRILPTGDHSKNIENAIQCYQNSLQVFTEIDFPVDWAITQNNLGGAYFGLSTGDREANLEQAIQCFQKALTVWTNDAFPNYFEKTTGNLTKVQRELDELINGQSQSAKQ